MIWARSASGFGQRSSGRSEDRKLSSSGVLLLQFNGMEVEQVRLDGERILTKSRAIADVRYSIEEVVTDPESRDVDTVAGQQL